MCTGIRHPHWWLRIDRIRHVHIHIGGIWHIGKLMVIYPYGSTYNIYFRRNERDSKILILCVVTLEIKFTLIILICAVRVIWIAILWQMWPVIWWSISIWSVGHWIHVLRNWLPISIILIWILLPRFIIRICSILYRIKMTTITPVLLSFPIVSLRLDIFIFVPRMTWLPTNCVIVRA